MESELFVGYTASSRLSELWKKNPQMFERRYGGNGKQYEWRFRFEAIEQILAVCDMELAQFLREELEREGYIKPQQPIII